MKILLIEDDEMLLKAMTFQLEGKGHTVHLSRNGDQALDVVLDHIFDLVICDLMIPIVSGVTFLRIRRKVMDTAIPVIAMSSLDNAESMLTDLGVEYKFFLKKPIDFDRLFALIDEIQLQKSQQSIIK